MSLRQNEANPLGSDILNTQFLRSPPPYPNGGGGWNQWCQCSSWPLYHLLLWSTQLSMFTTLVMTDCTNPLLPVCSAYSSPAAFARSLKEYGDVDAGDKGVKEERGCYCRFPTTNHNLFNSCLLISLVCLTTQMMGCQCILCLHWDCFSV